MKIAESIKSAVKCLLLSIIYRRHPGCRRIAGQDHPWADDLVKSEAIPLFAHRGGVGDILFSLHFCREITGFYGKEQFDYHIYSSEAGGLPESAAEFLMPLLKKQPFIRQVSCGGSPPRTAVELDEFRDLKLNFSSGDIRNWYYQMSKAHLPREFTHPVISCDAKTDLSDRILICNTPRYNNIHVDLYALEEFKESLIFTGLQGEYEMFCRQYFEVPRLACGNMLELAEVMAGAGGFIGNQSGIYSLAECMKIPRILIAPDFIDYHGIVIPGPHNNHPAGGWCEDVASTAKMVEAMRTLLRVSGENK